MANSEFIGLNIAGASKILAAIEAYEKQVSSVNCGATAAETQVFAKGSLSYNSMMTMFRNADAEMARLVTTKLEPLKQRINNLTTQYKANDEALASTMNTQAKSILKS